MEINLLHVTPMSVLVKAIRTCYDSHERSDSVWYTADTFDLGPKDKALIQQIIDSGHLSTLEHVNFTFYLKGFSRAVLQQLSRHRITTPSVKSSRYTLKELKNEPPFLDKFLNPLTERASKYLVFTGVEEVDIYSVWALEHVRRCVSKGIQNDKAKYCMPDAYKTDATLTLNVRSFRNLLQLRTSEKALWEFQDLAHGMFSVVPEEYKFLMEDCVHGKL